MNMYQRSDDWHSQRIGKITASRIKDITAKPQKGKALNATQLALIAERLTGQAPEPYINKTMQWGIDNEPLAITAYENATGEFVVNCGLIDHPNIAMSGASPDGLIGDDGQIEIKCPDSTTHINTLLKGEIPDEYLPQISWQLACTGRAWCDFVSFDPRLPDDLQLFIKRIGRDDLPIDELEKHVITCNQLLNETIEKLTQGEHQ